MSEVIEKVRFFIERDELTTNSRKQEIVYKRAYLMHVLRCQKMPFKTIGSYFNKDHATVMYQCSMVKRYLHEIQDETYINLIREYLESFEAEKYKLEKHELISEILKCTNTYELKLIKERIKEKKYYVDATFLQE